MPIHVRWKDNRSVCTSSQSLIIRTGMENNPVKLVDSESSLPIPFQPFTNSISTSTSNTSSANTSTSNTISSNNNDNNDNNDISTSLLSPWNHIVLSPCLIGFGRSDYLCYPNACTNQVKIVDIHSGEIVNCLSGHIDYPVCCCYRESFCEL